MESTIPWPSEVKPSMELSRTTSTKLEFLAMKWAIEHFQTYLLGHRFRVHTDNNLLTYFLTSLNMDATKQRWINELAKYDFSLEYQKGKNKTVADALSQIQERRLSDREAEELLKDVPLLSGNETIVKTFEDGKKIPARRSQLNTLCHQQP